MLLRPIEISGSSLVQGVEERAIEETLALPEEELDENVNEGNPTRKPQISKGWPCMGTSVWQP